MTYCLDTSTLVGILRGNKGAEARLFDTAPSDIIICEVVRAELLAGALKSARPQHHRELLEDLIRPFRWISFGGDSVEQYAKIRSHLERAGTPIGPVDYFIAATALAENAIVVSQNLGEFSRVPGLQTEDWL